jgi:hypothetical protein
MVWGQIRFERAQLQSLRNLNSFWEGHDFSRAAKFRKIAAL